MDSPYRHIEIVHLGDVCCVTLRHPRLEEEEIHEVGDELLDLIDTGGCRKLLFDFGPVPLECLYSVFLAKLFTVRRHLVERGGVLKLAEVTADMREVFRACRLDEYFEFEPDRATALATLAR
jgi:hypothetical protein